VEKLTFMDLAILERIDETTTVEKFGPKINSTFFDAANILGTLKQKGYIDIQAQFPGPSKVNLTDKGKEIITAAKEKGAQEVEKLDELMLSLIANGFIEPKALSEKMNLRGTDVAFHLERLVMQNYASYVFKSGKINLALTDEGFKRAGYPPLATEEERAKESEEVKAIIEEQVPTPEELGPAPPVQQPVKLDQDARRKAKLDYYKKNVEQNIVKYAVIAGVIIIILLAATYFLFLQ
jgi:hypothetical protein